MVYCVCMANQPVLILQVAFSETCLQLMVLCRTFRYCSEDCMLNGVQFKKGALVFLIIHTIHHDSNTWPDPQEFNPDRYLVI